MENCYTLKQISSLYGKMQNNGLTSSTHDDEKTENVYNDNKYSKKRYS